MKAHIMTIHKTILLTFLTLIFCIDSSLKAAAPPNVVLLISDDQAWNHYSFMNHEAIQTPHIDQLAKESLTFTRGYVPTSLCRPSLATLISGLYPYQHRISGNDPAGLGGKPGRLGKQGPQYNKLRAKLIANIDKVPSIVKMLGQEKGYVSHQSGKWWEGNFKRGGFTEGMTRGFPQPGGRHGDDGLKIGRQGMKPVFDFIDKSQKEKKPFFVWYAPFLPHSPHNPPERLLKKYTNKTDSLHKAKYWAMCEWFDETCGQLLDHLKQNNLDENTIVIYVIDNGWMQRDNAKSYAPRSKRSPNEGGIRTPIMIRWLGKVKPRMDQTTLVSSIDIAPTILKACGLQPTKEMKGLNLLDAEAVNQRKIVYGDIYEHDIVDIDKPVASLRYLWCIEGDWKLILPSKHMKVRTPELYNVTKDPHENKNLATEHPERVKQLAKKIDTWYNK